MSFAQFNAGLAAKSHEEYVRRLERIRDPIELGHDPGDGVCCGTAAKAAYVLFGVALVLLIASANVAGSSRASKRTKEFAIVRLSANAAAGAADAHRDGVACRISDIDRDAIPYLENAAVAGAESLGEGYVMGCPLACLLTAGDRTR